MIHATLKHWTKVVWADLPKIENPFFARHYVKHQLQSNLLFQSHWISNLADCFEKPMACRATGLNERDKIAFLDQVADGHFLLIIQNEKPFSAIIRYEDKRFHPKEGGRIVGIGSSGALLNVLVSRLYDAQFASPEEAQEWWQAYRDRNNSNAPPARSKSEETVSIRKNDFYQGLGTEGLHNQEWDDVAVERGSFKTIKPVDMDKLSKDEIVANDELRRQGNWKNNKIEEILSSGKDFKTKDYKPGDKLYGFNTAGRGKDIKTSAFWMDEAGYQEAKSKFYKNGVWDKEGLKNHLALPCFNRADGIDVVEITEKTTGVESTVGKATELIKYTDNTGYTTGTLGKIMGGGGKQVTVPTQNLKAIPGL